jgi:riboflavin synthase
VRANKLSILPAARAKSNDVFTGLIEEVGRVVTLDTNGASAQLQVTASKIAPKVSVGDSVAVNGCCLTVSAKTNAQLTFDLLKETLERTNLKQAGGGSPVNLERAVAAGSPMGGHFVQGHIDCTAKVISFEQSGQDFRLEIELPVDHAKYAAEKGSIAIDGISLTIAEVLAKSVVVWIIPHTKRETNVGALKPGDLVNVEFDILAKYVERMVSPDMPGK